MSKENNNFHNVGLLLLMAVASSVWSSKISEFNVERSVSKQTGYLKSIDVEITNEKNEREI